MPTAGLAVAIVVYVAVGRGGTGGGLAAVIAVALLLVGLQRVRQEPAQAALLDRVAGRALLLVPGASVLYMSFQAGGFFPGAPALLAVGLALIVAARLVLAGGGGAPGRLAAGIAVTLGAYAVFALASGAWSHAPERAGLEADLPLLYGLGFVLCAGSVAGARDLRWVIRGLVGAISIVCLGALLSRAVPSLWPIPASLDTARLSYPLTYWNGLGILAAFGIVLSFGISSDDRGSRLWRTLGAVPVPLLAATLLLTFSRGGIAAGILALVAYVALGRPRSLLGAAVAIGPSAGIATIVAYRATALAHTLDGSQLQLSQGHHLALVVGACCLGAGLVRGLLVGLDGAVVRWSDDHPVGFAAAAGGCALSLGAVVVAALAFGLPHTASTQYQRFVQGGEGHAQLRDRLTDPGADGRISLWRVAVHEFDGAPVHGTGAGTFAVAWTVHRPDTAQALDAHSLYLENLGELGVIGFGLLACALLALLVGVVRRVRGHERTLYAAVFAVMLGWAVHAGVDWDWELPAVTLPIFMLGGAALGRLTPAARPAAPRPLLAVIALVAVVLPALVSVSQGHLDTSVAAFVDNDCAGATGPATSALSPFSARRAPHEILGYCDAARGEAGPALAEMAAAARADPKSWEPEYGLAVVRAALGRDPRTAMRAAVALDPREPLVVELASELLRRDRRSQWPQDAAAAPLPISGQPGAVFAALRAGVRR